MSFIEKYFAGKIHSRPGAVSDAVYLEIIGTLYGTLVPIVFAGVAQAIVGSITAWQTGDVATAVLTALGVAVAVVRVLGVLAFRHRTKLVPELGRREAMGWEWRYAAGSGVTALILGLFAARSLILDDAICSVMAIGIAFGFGAGVVARLSLRPAVAVLDLSVIGFPIIVTSLVHPDLVHLGLAALMIIYFAGSLEMVRLTYNAMLNQLTLKQQFEQLARIDPMTGLFNRSVLDSDLVRMVSDREAGMVAVHAVDLDHFKAANDRFGHPVGDALLKEVAKRLTALAGQGDLIVRMGGDEFILVQKSVRSCAEAEAMAQCIFETVSAPYCVAGHDIVIGASIGIAVSPGHGQTVVALLSRSDSALYRAKANRGGYVFAGDVPAPELAPGSPAETASRQFAA